MFRHSWAIATSLVTVLGFIAHVPAQIPAANSPSTAYRQNGKWVGYVPSHQKYAQRQTGQVFRSSVPDVTSCLAGKADAEVTAACAVEPATDSAEPFAGALLDSEEGAKEPRVLAVGFDEPTPAFGPEFEGVPEFDSGRGDDGRRVLGRMQSLRCGSCLLPAGSVFRHCRIPALVVRWEWGTPPLATTSPVNTPQDQAGVLRGNQERRFCSAVPIWTVTRCPADGSPSACGLIRASVKGSNSATSHSGHRPRRSERPTQSYAILARPFYNTVDGEQDSRLIAFDSLVSGSLVTTASTSFEGGEFLLRQAVQRDCWAEIDLFLGYRWLQLEDGLLIEELTQSLVSASAGTSFALYDRFDTRNSFHGGEVGMSLRRQVAHCWSVELLAKLAIGNVNSEATVDGQTITIAPTGTSVRQGGLLAQQPTNMGAYERDKLATATEVGVKLKRSVGSRTSLTVGYTFLYLSDVLRAGDQIDTNINGSQLPPGTLTGAAFPEFSFQSGSFWAQGLSIGIEGCF